ncbi:MAG: sulfatase family protein [Vicinamibacteraceae bacterium]
MATTWQTVRRVGMFRCVLLVVLPIIAMIGAGADAGRSPVLANAPQSSRPQPTRPNILLAIADDWSYGHAGAYGSKWVKTPGFDRVAREGLLFTRAYTPNAKCAPSRASILTGRNSWQLEDAANHVPFFPRKFTTYPEALAAGGYTVGSTGKGWGPGVANDADGNPRHLAGAPYGGRRLHPPAGGIAPTDYAGNFEDFLRRTPEGAPWCFWLGAMEPHRRYEYGSGVAKGGKKLSDIDRVPAFWPDNEIVRTDLLDYALEVEHFDRHLVRMLEHLERAGELDNTLVVVTSDHGMPAPRAKGQAYDASNHVPLAVMWKNGLKRPGRTIDDYVSLIDLAATFIELSGLRVNQTGMAPITGRSLTDILWSHASGRVSPERDHVLIGKERHDVGRPHDWGYPIRAIVKNDMLYIRNFEISRWPAGNPETGYLNCDGSPTKTEVLKTRTDPATRRFWELSFGKRPQEELYDLEADPDCVKNLADEGAYRQLRTQLEGQLVSELKAQRDPRMFGNGKIFDQYPYAEEQFRNFYERYMKGEKLAPGWVNESDVQKQP